MYLKDNIIRRYGLMLSYCIDVLVVPIVHPKPNL